MSILRLTSLVCAVCVLGVTQLCSAQAVNSVAEPGDPARWYQNDATPHDYFMTLKKEAEAAYLEAKISCHAAEKSTQARCLKDAQTQYQQDLQDARSKGQGS